MADLSAQERVFWHAMRRALLAMVHAIEIRLGMAGLERDAKNPPSIETL